ncbi:MAG: hypothetical protein LCH30_06390 [Proteobacteria bacterium]|nr:hypothetical protein [Pseudomonadota bacterium]
MPLTSVSQFQLGAASPITGLPLYDLFLSDKEIIKEKIKIFKEVRKKAFDYFLSDTDKCTKADQEAGVRVYIDKGLSDKDKQTIEASCNRSKGYRIPRDEHYLVRSRVIASACHFVADASGNFFPESPVPAIMLTAPSPNLNFMSRDVAKFCSKSDTSYTLRQATYKNEMIKVWTRFLYAANEEAKSKGIKVEVLAPLIGGGAYLRVLSHEDKITARMIIAEALIKAANQGGFDNIKTIHFFIIKKKDDETYSKVESIFKQPKNKDYKGKPINLVANGDILKAGQILVGQGRNIVLCNPGSDHVPGGGAYNRFDPNHPMKGERGRFYGEINALEEQFADYSNFLLMQNLEQNPNENVNNFESLCREIPLPLRFKGLKFLGDKTKDWKNRKDASGTLCYELICKPLDKFEIEQLLKEGGITILKNESDCRIKYSKTAKDGSDSEELAKEILGFKAAADIAPNSMLYAWTPKMGPNNAITAEATSSQQIFSQDTSARSIFDVFFKQDAASPAIPLSSTRRDESPKPANQCQSKKELLANVNAADELGLLLSSFKIEEFTIFSLDIKERLCKLALKASTLGGILFCLKEDQINALCLTLKYELNNWVKSPDDLFRCICTLNSEKIIAFCMAFSKEDFLNLYRSFADSTGFKLLEDEQQRMLLKVVEIKLSLLDHEFSPASAAPSNSGDFWNTPASIPEYPPQATSSSSGVSSTPASMPEYPTQTTSSSSGVSSTPAIAQTSATSSNSVVSSNAPAIIPGTLSFYYTAPAKKDSVCESSLILKKFQF